MRRAAYVTIRILWAKHTHIVIFLWSKNRWLSLFPDVCYIVVDHLVREGIQHFEQSPPLLLRAQGFALRVVLGW